MHDKWIILVAGVSTVFVALVGLIFLVNLLKLIFGTRPQKVRKGLAPLPEIHSPAVAPKPVDSKKSDAKAGLSREIVAAIAVAISEASGIPASQFRIASITPAEEGFNTPVWGRIERFTRK
ncbi:MAG: hypothetical protein FD137_796 [Spirochaetes bacterium]|nr:MAG: hypothetical protein FD137_796 [Spirochaetota bacterium]